MTLAAPTVVPKGCKGLCCVSTSASNLFLCIQRASTGDVQNMLSACHAVFSNVLACSVVIWTNTVLKHWVKVVKARLPFLKDELTQILQLPSCAAAHIPFSPVPLNPESRLQDQCCWSAWQLAAWKRSVETNGGTRTKGVEGDNFLRKSHLHHILPSSSAMLWSLAQKQTTWRAAVTQLFLPADELCLVTEAAGHDGWFTLCRVVYWVRE